MLDEKDWVLIVKDGTPKKNGEYLCTTHGLGRDHLEILSFADNLEKVDEYAFFGHNRAGWYTLDSEVGYYEVTDVVAWMELPKPYPYNPFKV